MTPENEKSPDPRSPISDTLSGGASDSRSKIQDPRSASGSKRKVVLAIASAGGHWVQLRRLHPAFKGTHLIYSTTKASYGNNISDSEFLLAPDGNLSTKLRLIRCAIKTFLLVLKAKPDVIISTGAAPGYFAILYGKLLGKKTIWVDSIANAGELSLSGKKVGKHVDYWITQWKHLTNPEGPHFFGNVLGDEIANDVHSAQNPLLTMPYTKEGGSTICHQPTDSLSSSAITHKPSGQKLRIFVTVGTDMPFNRLIETLDQWAPNNPEVKIVAQIGEAGTPPRNFKWTRHLDPDEYKKIFNESDLILSHAGMGTILTSLIEKKRLLIMPRIAAKGEHRNEHQLATAMHLQKLGTVNVAQDENELIRFLDTPIRIQAKSQIGPHASKKLTNKLATIINAN